MATRPGMTPHPRSGRGGIAWLPLCLLRLPLCLLAAACLNTTEEPPPAGLETVDADEIVYGVSLNMSRDGIREATLTADSMFSWRDSTHARVMGLSLIVYNERGGRRATITADQGRLNRMGNELTATGSAVLAIPGQGREIRTEELHFALEVNRVWTDVPVVMLEGGCEFEGDRLQSDMDFDDVRIWGTRERGCS